MKRCKVCGTSKPTSEFYADAKMADGLLSKCKSCHIARVLWHRYSSDAILEGVRAYNKERGKRPHVRQRSRESGAHKAWVARYPERNRAHMLLKAAVKEGRVVKPSSCAVAGCTRTPIEGHHDDYSKPLEVQWLCRPHHYRADEARRQREQQQEQRVAA